MINTFESESLCDELLSCLGKSESGMFDGIWHPLVVSVPYSVVLNKQLNAYLAYKQEEAQKAVTAQNWERYIFLHERAFRLDALKKVVAMTDDSNVIWPLIATAWVDSENIHQNLSVWREMWGRSDHNRNLFMEEEELKAFDHRPPTLTVYRGVNHPDAAEGLSWTTNRAVAKMFAKRQRTSGLVVTGEVHKEHVLAYFTNRNEAEVVALPENVRVISIKEVA